MLRQNSIIEKTLKPKKAKKAKNHGAKVYSLTKACKI